MLHFIFLDNESPVGTDPGANMFGIYLDGALTKGGIVCFLFHAYWTSLAIVWGFEMWNALGVLVYIVDFATVLMVEALIPYDSLRFLCHGSNDFIWSGVCVFWTDAITCERLLILIDGVDGPLASSVTGVTN